MSDQTAGMKDRGLKDLVLRHFWAQRCYVHPEVELRYRGGLSGDPKLITDVDVLVLRPHPDLLFEKILADCRTLKGQSPIARVLWLKGLMELLGARTGLVVLARTTRIESDHQLAANHLGIRLLSEEDFKAFDRAIVYPEGSERIPVSTRDLQVYRGLARAFPPLEPLVTYVYRDSWLEEAFGDRIRHILGHLKGAAGEFDPRKVEHLALFCDVAGVFSIALAECAGEVFHQYLQPAQKEELSESLKLMIWGGREQYQFYQTIRRRMLEARSGGEVSPLNLPEWNEFVQVVRNLLERPSAGFEVPLLLRRLALEVLRGREPLRYVRRSDALALKFGMLILSYLAKASGVPREFERFFVDVLVKAQSWAISGRERIGEDRGSAPKAADGEEEREDQGKNAREHDEPRAAGAPETPSLFGDVR